MFTILFICCAAPRPSTNTAKRKSIAEGRFGLETLKQLPFDGVASQIYLTTALYNHFEAAPVYIPKRRAATMII